jgi:hypothetical protein
VVTAMMRHSRNTRITLTLDHPNYKATLQFGNDKDKVKLITDHFQLDEIYFYGFSGEIDSPLFEVIHSRPRAQRTELISEFLRTIKYSILKKVLSLTEQSPELVYRHRHIIVRIAIDEDFGTQTDRTQVGNLVPVLLLGSGWKTINQLHNKDVFVEVMTNNIPSFRAERASRYGYNVVCAWSALEQMLLEKMLGARNLESIQAAKPDPLKTTIMPSQNQASIVQDDIIIEREISNDDLEIVKYSNDHFVK